MAHAKVWTLRYLREGGRCGGGWESKGKFKKKAAIGNLRIYTQ